MVQPTQLSTDDLAPRERAPQWREWVWSHFGGLDSDLYGDTTFDGHIAAARAGDVVLTRLEANRHRVLRTPEMARKSDAGYIKIVAPWQGNAGVEQAGRQAWVRPGSWTLYDTSGSYTVSNPERSNHLIVMVPKAAVLSRDLRLEPLMARQAGGQSGISRVALDTMRSTYQELPHMSADAARGAGELITQLVRLSLQELAGQTSATTQQMALRDRVLDFVAQHLHEPGLTIERIAQALNCSKRLLHNAFAGDEDTLAGTIQRLRLEACVRTLRDPAQHTRAITDIALGAGFNNLSHFSRVFRQHTGFSPRDFREASQAKS